MVKLYLLSLFSLFILACGASDKSNIKDFKDEAYLKEVGDSLINKMPKEDQERVKDIFQKRFDQDFDRQKFSEQLCHIGSLLMTKEEKIRQDAKEKCLKDVANKSDAELKTELAYWDVDHLIDAGFSARELLNTEKAYDQYIEELSNLKLDSIYDFDDAIKKIEDKLKKEFDEKIANEVINSIH